MEASCWFLPDGTLMLMRSGASYGGLFGCVLNTDWI